MTRRAITKTQLKPLIALTRNMCAMHDHAPSCDGFSLVRNDIFVGEIAHIAAAEEGGKRWDATMDDDQRNSNENLIVLCPNHHTLIDSDEDTYTTPMLLEAKRTHEESADQQSFDPPDHILDEAEKRVDTYVQANNVNSGAGTQINLNASHISLMMSPSSSAQLIVPTALPISGTDQTLTLQVDIRVISLPILGQPDQTSDTMCYRLHFNGRLYVLPQTSFAQIITGIQPNSTTGKYNLTNEQIALILKNVYIYEDDQLGTVAIFDDIKSLVTRGSLMVIIECTDSNILAVPFENLVSANFDAANYIVFAHRQGNQL